MKSAGYGAPVDWHQDWAFYPHINDDLAAVGIMLDDCTLENGPMLVLPGSHLGPIYDHHAPDGRFCGAFDPPACGVDVSGDPLGEEGLGVRDEGLISDIGPSARDGGAAPDANQDRRSGVVRSA